MAQEGSLPYSQESATGPYHVTDESSPHLHILIYFNIILTSTPTLEVF
jgi:hypothetical protein